MNTHTTQVTTQEHSSNLNNNHNVVTTKNMKNTEINIDNSRFGNDSKKLQNYYQDYINTVEAENQQIRSQITNLRTSLGKNKYY